MNSFQAIEDAPKSIKHSIHIIVEREPTLSPSPSDPAIGFKIVDSGIGFTDANYDSFTTADSDYKAKRGGKGLGRFLWLKAFEKVEISSDYLDPTSGAALARRFTFDVTDDDSGAQPVASSAKSPHTVVRLVNYQDPYRAECPRDLKVMAQRFVGHFLPLFLDPDGPAITLSDEYQEIDLRAFFREHVQALASEHPFEVGSQIFSLRGFRLQSGFHEQHQIVFSAHFREVISERLARHISNLKNKLVDSERGPFAYLCLVQGPYLDGKVNNGRTDFNIPRESHADGDLLPDDLSLAQIRDAALKVIRNDLGDLLAEIDAAKIERITAFVNDEAPEYRPLLKDLQNFIDQIPPGASSAELDAALHRRLYVKQVELREQGAQFIVEAVDAADTEDYDRRFKAYIEQENEIGKSALAKYITHRRVILELLERAVSVSQSNGKYPLEKAVHRLVFPMRKTSIDVPSEQQNLWVIDERLSYHAFLSSDEALNKTGVLDTNSESRPDILIFNRPLLFGDGSEPMTSMVVIEFKRADRSDYREEGPVDQVFRMVREVREGAKKDIKGRPIRPLARDIPAYCYIICDLTDDLETDLQNRGAHPTPDRLGYYAYNPTLNAYYEVISYNKLLTDAKRRNRMLFERLSLPSSGSD